MLFRSGDLIIRSSDAVDFRVSSVILKFSSDVFSTMLEACQAGGGEVRDGCTVVQFQEDSETLDCLFRILYPRKAPAFDDVAKVSSVLCAALKYDLDKAVEVVSGALRAFAPTVPLRVWCIAIRCRQESEARAAADEMVRQSLQVLDLSSNELQDLHAGAYYRLLLYTRLRGSVRQDFTFCNPSRAQIKASASSASEQDPQFVSSSHQRIRPLADVLCRSSDGMEFPAHRALLALASPVLGASVAGLPPPIVSTDGDPESPGPVIDLPVLSFEEDSATLQTLLMLCYPGADESKAAQQLLVVTTVSDALKEYEMEDAQALLRRSWSRLLKTDPLQAYLVAKQHEASNEANEAERELFASGRNMDDYYVAAMELTPASVYRTLLVTHRERRRGPSLFGGLAWSVESATSPSGAVDRRVVVWFPTHLCLQTTVPRTHHQLL